MKVIEPARLGSFTCGKAAECGKVTKASPTPTGSGVGGVDPTFLIMYKHKGEVNPLTFCQKCMGTRGVTPQNEACMSARCWKCIIGRGIEPENVCFVGAPLTRANGYINFSKCMQSWGVCTSIQLIFFLGNLLKPMGKPGNTWGHRKYSALKTPLAYAFGFFWKQTHANICKHDQARIAPTPKT